MRAIIALPLAAAFALSACGNDGEEAMTDEALAADEVSGVIEDNGTMPAPGEYATSVELIEFDAPNMAEEDVATARSEFEAGAGQPNLYCLTEDVTREAWLSEMVEAECTLSRFTANGEEIDGAMMCSSDIGLNGRVELAGTSGEESSDLRMTYTLPAEAGEGTVRMRVTAERSGDCG